MLVASDDLIWASRLRGAVERAGAVPVGGSRMRTAADPDVDDGPRGAVVDLSLRGEDATRLIAALVAARVPVIAVGQHDDLAGRRRALGAGASRVFSYDKLFRDGPAVIRAWLDGIG